MSADTEQAEGAVATQEQEPELVPGEIPPFKVLLHNDDVNTMDHVVQALLSVFRFDRHECERIMFEAHTSGTALCATEPMEQAELHRDQLISFSLTATIEPA